MAGKLGNSGKANSIPGGLAIALSTSLIITFGLSTVLAYCLNAERITWSQAGYWIMGMLFAASYIGGKCAFTTIKRQKSAVCFMTGILYWSVLLCITALFFGGNYEAIWETAGIIGAGSGSAALISMPKSKKTKRRSHRGYC